MIRPEYQGLNLDAFLERLAVTGHAVEDLARAWATPPMPDRLALAFAAAGVELDWHQAIRAWVSLDWVMAQHRSKQVLRDMTIDDLCDTYIEHAELRPGLHVPDDELRARLPLLELAEDLARRDGRLVVESTAPSGLWGCIGGTLTRGTVILVDATLDAKELEETFAHELGHGLDPEPYRIVRSGAEVFADEMARLLLEASPKTIKAAVPLVIEALEATRGQRIPMPDGSLVSLLEEILTEVGATCWSGPELLAARCGGSGRQTRSG